MKIEHIDITENKNSTTYRVRVPYYEDGKRKYISKSFCSDDYGSKKIALEQAKIYRDKVKFDVNNSSYVNKSLTLQEIFDKMTELSPVTDETKRKDRVNYNKYIASKIPPNRNFKDISINDIQETLNAMQNSKSDNNIQNTLTCWKKMYDFAIKNNYVAKDLTRLVVKPKSRLPQKTREVSFSKKEFDELLETIERGHVVGKELLISALLIMYYLGIRPAECFALEKDCIDKEKRIVSIHQAISHKGRTPYISRTKTDLSVRKLPYPTELDQVFENFDGFRKADGELWDSDFASSMIYRITKGKFRMYMLRHLFATDYFEQGINPRTIQEMMGHKTSAQTLDYARSNEDKIKLAMSIKR